MSGHNSYWLWGPPPGASWQVVLVHTDDEARLRELFDAARKLYALMRDPETPLWVKGMCAAALGYLILPTDAVTDLVPVLGYSDDLAVLAAAIAAIATRWGTTL